MGNVGGGINEAEGVGGWEGAREGGIGVRGEMNGRGRMYGL